MRNAEEDGCTALLLFLRYAERKGLDVEGTTLSTYHRRGRYSLVADVARSHYIISEEIIADTIPRVAERQWD